MSALVPNAYFFQLHPVLFTISMSLGVSCKKMEEKINSIRSGCRVIQTENPFFIMKNKQHCLAQLAVQCSTGSQCQRKNERAIYRNACNGYRSGDNIVSHCLKSIRLVVMKLDITCFQHNFNGIFRLIVCKSTACFWWSACCACSKAYASFKH